MVKRGVLKNIFSCILFLAILFVLFCKITWLYRGNDIDARECIQGFKNQGDVDVVLVGGSTLFRYYNPLQAWKETGITSYNYATPAARFDILKEYIEDSRKTNEADLYVINVRTIALLSQEVDESSLRNWSDSLEPTSYVRIRGINDYLSSRNWDYRNLPSYYFDIIRYHSNKNALPSEKQWYFMDLDRIYDVDKGFHPGGGCVPAERKEWGESRRRLSDQQQNALNDILDYCDKEKIQTLFICCPYIFTETDEGIINTCGDVIRDRGYSYVNFNEYYDEMGLDFGTDFSDPNHMNYFGSKKYTHYLINYLSSNYQLTDHRGEPEYHQWDVDYETYMPTLDEVENKLTDLVQDQIRAKEEGEKLSREQDFSQWYEKIKNKNYSVIIRINEMPKDIPLNNSFHTFLKDYSIDTSKETYIGVWCAMNTIISASNESSVKASIGDVEGRAQCDIDLCSISVESEMINIGNVDYVANESPIQVVVYDNNYQKVIDNVNIQIGPDDSVVLRRP